MPFLLSISFVFIFKKSLLEGTLPSELGLMTQLEILDVLETDLVGGIPSELGLLSNARTFHFHFTKLRGSMPQEICELNGLIDLVADCVSVDLAIPAQVDCEWGKCCTDCFA